MWVQSSVWLFTVKEYNKISLIRFPRNFTIWRAMKFDLESCLDVSELDVWLDVFDLKSRAVDLISNKIEGKSLTTLIWRSSNDLDFDREQGCYFGPRDDSLFWQSVSRVFLSLFLCLFLIWETSIYRQLNSIWFGIFSQLLLRIIMNLIWFSI